MTAMSEEPAFEELLSYIKQSRGFDFTGYKRSSLMRRVNRRMQVVEIDSYADYLDYLEVHPEEFGHLFNTMLINVTSFFRDRAAWDLISSTIVPRILATKGPYEPIRIWSAGCASGEEAYTLAIILAEILGIEQFRERVKIYATDVDEEALNQARQATYPTKSLSNLSSEQIAQYFEPGEDCYTFLKELRRSVIFGRHDLIQDAPISRLDLLVCRNTLMYLNAEAQSRILSRFHFALRDNGYLFLGKAEMLLTHTTLFIPLYLKCRIFNKVPRPHLQDQLLGLVSSRAEEIIPPPSSQMQLQELAFDAGPVARLVVDIGGVIVLINSRARILFNLSPLDVGRPLQDLEVYYQPRELRPFISMAYSERQMIALPGVEWQTRQGENLFLDVQIVPLMNSDGKVIGVSINFDDVSRYVHLQAELEEANHELETAYEELQSTNEELETTNEELQSTNEELETTNEELQSTNEELETMNEELQSANEEMQTVNEELQQRSEEINRSNTFLASILNSLKGGVVVVNRDLYVQIWDHKAEDLWGLRSSEAREQNFLILDIGLPVEQLRLPIRSCLMGGGATEVVLQAVNRRGRQIECRVTCTPLLDTQEIVQGVILLMEECAALESKP